MDVQYLKEHICEEIDGAKDYIKRAIEIKPMNPVWSKTLVNMSSMELDHATNLRKMFDEYYNKLSSSYETMPDYMIEAKECVDEVCTEEYAKVRYLHELYSK